jgi:hypothetical protein
VVGSNYWEHLDSELELARAVLQEQRLVAHKTVEASRIAVPQEFHNVQGQMESPQSLLDDRGSRTAVGVQESGADGTERTQDQQSSSAAMHGRSQTLNLEVPMSQLEKRNGIAR